MTTEEVKEGNKLIAEFMGTGYTNRSIPNWAFKIYDFDTIGFGAYMYHSSWDWLMPACKKFGNLYEVIDLSDHWDVYIDHCINIENAAAHYEIEPVFLILVEKIKWYNKIKRK